MNARNMDRCDISNRLREANDAYPAPLITWDEKLIEKRKLTDEPIRRGKRACDKCGRSIGKAVST